MSPRVVKKTEGLQGASLGSGPDGKGSGKGGTRQLGDSLNLDCLEPVAFQLSSGRSTWALGFGVTLVTWLVEPGVSCSL